MNLAAGIEPLPSSDRTDAVAQALARLISRADLQPGDRLPTERQLMTALAVGRSTVREAISRFQALGVVEARKGSGTFLRRTVSAGTIHLPLSIDATALRDRLLQTLEVRRGLEVEAGATAARRATPADIVRLEDKLVAMERVHLEKGTAGRISHAGPFHSIANSLTPSGSTTPTARATEPSRSSRWWRTTSRPCPNERPPNERRIRLLRRRPPHRGA